MKKVFFVGSSKSDIRDFPKSVRCQIGHQIYRLQLGLMPDDWKPLSTVGKGVKEIRVHAENEYRTFYVLESRDEIFVLHAFVKRSQTTPRKDIALGTERYKESKRFAAAKRKRGKENED